MLFQSKKNKPSQPTMDQKILIAKRDLELSKKKFESVIRNNLNQIHYYRNQAIRVDEQPYIQKIKNAYYMIGLINAAKERITEIDSDRLLFSAYNDTAAAMKKVNQIFTKVEKPRIESVFKRDKKMVKMAQAADARMEKAFSGVADMDGLVSDKLVNDLIAGASLQDCLLRREGYLLSPDSLQNPEDLSFDPASLEALDVDLKGGSKQEKVQDFDLSFQSLTHYM